MYSEGDYTAPVKQISLQPQPVYGFLVASKASEDLCSPSQCRIPLKYHVHFITHFNIQ